MDKRFLIVLRHAPYGRIDAAEAVRHLNGAKANGFQATLLLLEDGVYLAKAGQIAAPGWTDLAAALEQTLGSRFDPDRELPAEVYAHESAMHARGLTVDDLVPGCVLADDATAAGLLAAADATLIY